MRWQRIVFSVTVTEGLLTEVSEKRKGYGRKAIPPVVARIFSGDSTSPLTREARIYCFSKYSAVLEGLVQRSLSLATDKVERILKMLESQSKTIYGKK